MGDHDDHDDHEHDAHGHEHEHEHEHAHGHDHAHAPLERITHVHGGPPALDIGDGIGAMVVLVGDERLGTELFLESEVDGSAVHTGVWRRQLGNSVVAAAVFCELAEGGYRVLDGAGHQDAERRVSIVSGEVAELDLRVA